MVGASLGLHQAKRNPSESRNMKTKVFQIGILNTALVGMLGTMLMMPCAAVARLAQEGRSGGEGASALAVGSAVVLEGSSFPAPAGSGYQANPTTPQHDVFPAVFHNFGTILAGTLLLLPFGLSTLRILRRNRAG
jgi:hypothetical protein